VKMLARRCSEAALADPFFETGFSTLKQRMEPRNTRTTRKQNGFELKMDSEERGLQAASPPQLPALGFSAIPIPYLFSVGPAVRWSSSFSLFGGA